MEEESEYLKLPLEDRCIHKNWRARLNGYEQCVQQFAKITDEKSPEFTKFAPLIKKFVTDSNAVAQEKGLEAAIVFVENAHIAPRTAADVTSGIVQKCLAAPKRGTQEKSIELLLLYVEVEKYESVQEELIKGFTHKNPKVSSACVRAMTTALREFGNKVMAIKPLVKLISPLLEDRDKNVREEGKKLVVEMYRWVRQALKPQLNNLKPVQLQELEVEFDKLGNEKVVQTRFLRSQQELKMKMEAAAEEGGDDDEGEEEEMPVVDAYDLMEPVNILDKLPKDFYEKGEAKKWQERKEAMEALLPLTQNARLEQGDYHDMMKLLKKIIAKDTNVMIIALAGQCVAGLAKGLKKKFSPFVLALTEVILEKFKEKKINVVTALREAIDAIFQTTTLEAIQETVTTSLNNKNPSVKAETAAFLARSFCYCTPQILTKKILKPFVTDLVKRLGEPDPIVRDNSADALGVIYKVVGEKTLMPFINDLDNLKQQKIKEASEKAELKVKIPVQKSKPKPKAVEPPPKAPTKVMSGTATITKGPAKRPGSAPAVKGRKGGKTAASEAPVIFDTNDEMEIGLEESIEKSTELLGDKLISGITDSNWKVRLESMESFNNTLQTLDKEDIPTQALLRTLAQKPGLKDNNFQVMKLKLEAIKILAENANFSRRSGEVCIQDLVEKLGDSKNGFLVHETLMCIGVAAKLQWLGPEVMTRAFTQKNPKVQESGLKWLSEAIIEFGMVLQPKTIISDIKKAISHTNPGVRTAGITLCGTMYMYMGQTLRVFFEGEKASLLSQIDAEFNKMSGRTPPAPIRGGNRGTSDGTDAKDDDDVDAAPASRNLQDLIPRTNISSQISSSLISELADKNWKVRNEALQKITSILNEAKFIMADIGELPNAIVARLNDSNKNLAMETVKITAQLATALGPHCKPHTRTIVPGILGAMGDSKQNMREQAVTTLNTWVEQTSLKEVIDGDMFVDALKTGSPFLKSEIFSWLTEKLPEAPTKSLSKDELNGCVIYLFTALEDRNVDVRKTSIEAVYPFMLHLGYEGMSKHVSRVKPSSKNTVVQALEKARTLMPVKVTPNKKNAVKPQSAGAASGRANIPAKKTVRAASASRTGGSSSSKKEEDIDTSPLLQDNNMKQQRASDEQRLRILKWDFQTPRAEFINQLKDQMSSAGLNKQLMANMFHQDFKFHIKAIDALSEDLNDNIDACRANLDLILRWLSIRFFDTNPSVIMKAMDYLQQVFSYLSEEGYHLSEHEAYAFLPFLIIKLGDPKDPIRSPAKNIANIICKIYPASKVSPYLIEGLKTKNARQRAECLECLGSLIDVYGLSVCQPSPSASLKEIAKQIADRDTAVRNGALNALVQVYFKEGEKLYKMIGNLSDKDMSLLEERIKRSQKNRPVIKKPVESEAPTVRAGGRTLKFNPTPAAQFNPLGRETSDSDVSNAHRRFGLRAPSDHNTSQNSAPSSNANYRLDCGMLEKLLDDDHKPEYQIEEIPDLDSLLNFQPKLPTRIARPAVISNSRNNILNANFEVEDAAKAINVVISQVATPEANSVITALAQLDEVMQSDERRSELNPHVNPLLIAATLQYKLVLMSKMPDTNVNKEECIRIYRSLTNCLMMIFQNRDLGTKASRDILYDVIHVLFSIILDHRLQELDDGLQVIRSINVLVMKIAEKANFTNVFSAFIKLLHECVGQGGGSNKFTELVLKGNWKVIRIIPQRVNDLDITVILKDIHNFLVAYPANTWADRPSEIPLRTIKTLIQTLCVTYGDSVVTKLESIEGVQGSEVQKHVKKQLKKLKSEGTAPNSNKKILETQNEEVENHTKSPNKLSKAAHNVLSEIFRKIGSKENTKEGLTLLYEFKENNPEADIEPYLKKSSQFFQNYIERGLKRVEQERLTGNKMALSSSSEGSNISVPLPLSSIQVQDSAFNINVVIDQFKSAAAKAGFDQDYIDTAVKDMIKNK